MKIGLWTIACSAMLAVAAVACAQGDSNADDPTVATIGDEVITESQLEAMVGTSLVALRQKIYDSQVAELEEEIYQRLLKKAAAANEMTKSEYVKTRVDQLMGEPDEGEVVKLMTQFRTQLAEDDLQARAQIVQALKEREKQRLSEELRDLLFAEAGVRILLEPPRVEVTIGKGTPSRGTVGAPVVLIEYTDYQCPFCTRVQPVLDELVKRYEGQLLHVFKNLPLPMHAQAPLAGAAALCAQDQGKFWEFHDWLFQNQRTMDREYMVATARGFGMDADAFAACIDEGTYAAKVRAETAEAQSFGITGAPGFLINGRVLTGARPIELFEEIIDNELERKGIEIPPKQAAADATE